MPELSSQSIIYSRHQEKGRQKFCPLILDQILDDWCLFRSKEFNHELGRLKSMLEILPFSVQKRIVAYI